MIIIALVLILALAACGQKTSEVVNNDNTDRSNESMETQAPHDDDSIENEDNSDSTVHEDSDNDSDDDSTDNENTAELKFFTLEELSAYNGLDGMPAYVSVDGVVYDFTNLGA